MYLMEKKGKENVSSDLCSFVLQSIGQLSCIRKKKLKPPSIDILLEHLNFWVKARAGT